MVLGIGSSERAREAGISRRAVLRSGAAVTAGSYLAVAGSGTVAAQTDDNWPIQGLDAANTRHATETVPLTSDPTALVQADIGAGPYADFLLTHQVAYVHSRENGLGAVDIETGELLWRYDNGDVPLLPEGIDGSRLLARGLDGTLLALEMDTGDVAAEIPLENGHGLGYDGTGRWYAPVSEGRVVAGEVGSEGSIWETDVTGVGVRPAVADGHVVVSTVDTRPGEVDIWDPSSMDADGRLFALDATDGSVVWDASRVGAGVGAPAVRNGTVYWPGSDGDILAHDLETGERVWEFKTNGSFQRSLAVTGGAVIAGNRDGRLYGVDAETGDQIGRLDVGSPISTNPVVVDDVVYFGTDDGSVRAFRHGGEGQLWTFETGSTVHSLTPANDRLVVGTWDGYYVLGSSDSSGDGSSAGTAQRAGDGETGGDSGTGGDGGGDQDGTQRGLFTNGGDEPEAVSNAFNVTMLGFLLSVGGIVYQMFGGR